MENLQLSALYNKEQTHDTTPYIIIPPIDNQIPVKHEVLKIDANSNTTMIFDAYVKRLNSKLSEIVVTNN